MANENNNLSYCGRKGGWFKPPYRKFFNASCKIHDNSYDQGGDWIDRLKADQGFLRAMLRDCDRIPKKTTRTYYQAWSIMYYYAVRFFGNTKKSFNYKK